jgi:hypothetical protein
MSINEFKFKNLLQRKISNFKKLILDYNYQKLSYKFTNL